MLPASNKGPSLSFGFPDVCRTPVGRVIVPIPYPNFGAHATAATFSPIVSVGMIPALNQASILAMTTGDEPGVAHWTVRGPGTFDLGNPIVFVDMLPAINLTCQTNGNTGNNQPGCVVAPGTPKVNYTLLPAPRAPVEGASSERAGEEERFLGPVGTATALSEEERSTLESLSSTPPLDGEAEIADSGVARIRVSVFSIALPGALHLAIARARDRGARAIVLDLRGCPGGEWLSLVEVASDFLPAGALIASLRDADGDETPHRARGETPCRLPLAILVDGRTASAAELFAAILQAHGRATIVGRRTFGKGIAQAVFKSADGSRDWLGTVGEVVLPDGSTLPGTGVAPDVELPEEEALAGALSIGAALALRGES